MIASLPDEVHVWLARPEERQDQSFLAGCAALLDADEHARLDRFLVEHARLEFLVGRAFLRSVLGAYLGEAPELLALAASADGKPELRWPAPHVRFNLSNTAGLIACAITHDRDVGIDVERADREVEVLELADRFFASSEAADLRALAPALRLRRFFEYWTLKESYVKAVGSGLALPLDRFWFHLEDPPRVTFASGFADDAERWQFFQIQPTTHHLLAVAVAPAGGQPTGDPAPLRLVVRDAAALPW